MEFFALDDSWLKAEK